MLGRLEFLVWGGANAMVGFYGRGVEPLHEQGAPTAVDLESFKGKIDFGVISIREDEFVAVLERFAPDRYAMGSQRYEIGRVRTNGGGYYTVAAVRCVEQGQGHAQKVATDLIKDLEPRWLLVVGIGGSIPSMDFTLGDVVCATRVHDFSVHAVKEGAADTYSAGGGPMHPEIQRLLAALPAIVTLQLRGWNSPEAISTPKPVLRVPGANSNRYYGDVEWKAELRRALLYHFPKDRPPRPPLVTSRSVATSDALVKSTDLLSQWQRYARGVAAVEMELGGVFLAAKQIDREYPVLAIRGISDIVGFKREEQWTKYACATAAALAYALVSAGVAFEPWNAETSRWPHQPAEPSNSRPWRRVGSAQFSALVYALGTALPSVSQADDTAALSGVSRHLIRKGRDKPIQRWQAVLEQAIDDGVDDILCSEALKLTKSAKLRAAAADWIGT